MRVWIVAALLCGATSAEGATTLARVRETGTLSWGLDAQGGAPYAFPSPMDPNHLVGFEVDLADAIAHELGVTAHPVEGQWERLLELLDRGDFDVALNGIEVADEKRRLCTFSHPYYVAPEELTVRRQDAHAPRTLAALAGRRVGTLPGTIAERIAKRAGADVRTYEGGQDTIYDDLRLGRLDAVLLDAPATLYYGAIDPALEVVPGDFGQVEYAIAIRPGEDALKGAIDRALDALAHKGDLRAIYQRWGLWNAPTAALLGDSQLAAPRLATRYEEWRSAVGQQPPFWQRVIHRYPALLPLFARGALLTLLLSIASMLLAIVLGVSLAIGRLYGPRPLRMLCLLYVEVVRGTPLLVQLLMIYFGLPELGLKLDPLLAGFVALGLNYAAAEAENVRAGLSSVAVGQHEAAWSLGLSHLQALRYVVAPQAIRIALPPMTNDFIALLKDSSLVALVTITELTKTYLDLASATRDHLGLGLLVAIFYLAIGLPFAQLARYTEKRLASRLRRLA